MKGGGLSGLKAKIRFNMRGRKEKLRVCFNKPFYSRSISIVLPKLC